MLLLDLQSDPVFAPTSSEFSAAKIIKGVMAGRSFLLFSIIKNTVLHFSLPICLQGKISNTAVKAAHIA